MESLYGRPKWILNIGVNTVQVQATIQTIQLNIYKEQTNVYQRMILTGLYVYHSGSRQRLKMYIDLIN